MVHLIHCLEPWDQVLVATLSPVGHRAEGELAGLVLESPNAFCPVPNSNSSRVVILGERPSPATGIYRQRGVCVWGRVWGRECGGEQRSTGQ